MATYTITYNLNGGSGSFPSQNANEGTSITLNSATPTKTNYTFVRWDSSTGMIYTPGSTFSENKSVTLTAAWTPTPSGFVAVTSVQITSKPSSTLNIIKGQTAQYTCTVSPSNATDQTVIWTPRSNINSVANVTGSGTGGRTGTITATGVGTAAITVRSNASNNRTDSFNVKVVNADSFIQETVLNYFTGNGFTKKQAAGIMGNIMQESGWNPLRRGSGSQYWGLVQLNQTLSQDLNSAYSAAGLNMSDYGYNVSKYQGIGAQNNIPINDLTKILSVQLKFIWLQTDRC